MRFRVWAPVATKVDIVAGGKRYPMRPGDRGYHEGEAPLYPGDDYAFSLDGGDPLPDPRSQMQPEGVHGPSRIVDHMSFMWGDHDWCPDPIERWVIYELHVGTFTPEGTFDAAIGKLDHLRDLGINAVELMPVGAFPGQHGWGYDGVDLFAPHLPYGGPDGLKRLVDACHTKGIAVVLDVVYNHLGPAGNYLGSFGPYFTDVYATPWGDAINFDDAGSDAVRDFVIDNALQWIVHYRIDGLRLDAIHAILDRSAVHILEELSASVEDAIERLGRPVYLIAESDLNDPRVVTPRTRGGLGVDAQWNDDFHHALHSVLTGEDSGYYSDFGSISRLAKALTNAYVFTGDYSAYRNRRHGRPPAGRTGQHFLAYAQDHDQVGNRAAGDRLCHTISPGLAKVAAALVLTSPFVPMLFMGEEWAASTPFQYFTDHDDPELAAAISEGRRKEFEAFGWDPADVPDPQDPATFNRSKLNWDEIDSGLHKDMLEWHKELIALRRAEPALQPGDLAYVEVRCDENDRWMVVRRGPFRIACNFGDGEVTVDVRGDIVLTSDLPEVRDEGLVLPPESVSIVRA